MTPRHFLTGAELGPAELEALLDRALELKGAPLASRALAGRGVALIFEKPSTRTRLSFEMGVHELGGHPVVLRSGEMQLSRGESAGDTALVLSRQVAAVGMRTGPDSLLEELAAHAQIPVFNMLTALHHPCQALADLMTVREAFGALPGLRLAYVGDATNVARSLAILGTLAGMDIAIASPPGYSLEQGLSLPPGAEGSLTLYRDPLQAASGAHVLYTDVWVSMGDEATAQEAGQNQRDPAGPSAHIASTTRCSTRASQRRSRFTACPLIRARRSQPRCSTVRASASGTKPRIAATRRRPCSSCSSSRLRHERAAPSRRQARRQRP
jgi:ornithine carbamoyltransferase